MKIEKSAIPVIVTIQSESVVISLTPVWIVWNSVIKCKMAGLGISIDSELLKQLSLKSSIYDQI